MEEEFARDEGVAGEVAGNNGSTENPKEIAGISGVGFKQVKKGDFEVAH